MFMFRQVFEGEERHWTPLHGLIDNQNSILMSSDNACATIVLGLNGNCSRRFWHLITLYNCVSHQVAKSAEDVRAASSHPALMVVHKDVSHASRATSIASVASRTSSVPSVASRTTSAPSVSSRTSSAPSVASSEPHKKRPTSGEIKGKSNKTPE